MPDRPCWTRTALIAALFAPGVQAQPGAGQEEAASTGSYQFNDASREVRAFDFDEQDTNVLPIPEGWFRAQDDPGVPRNRPGFPIYNVASLDYESRARSGNGTLRLETRGGSTSLRLQPGVLSVFPGADYRVRAYVRSELLGRARFQLSARFLDQRGREVPGSLRLAPLAEPAEDWTPVEITLLGLREEAAYLQIDLELLQPREFEAAILGEHHVWEDDLEGAFFVDDVVVTQLPRVELQSTSPANIVTAPETAELLLLVRDLNSDVLTAKFAVYDATGNLVDTAERPIFGGSAPIRLRPKLPEYGWYRAEAIIWDQDGPLSGTFCDLVYIPPARSTDEVLSCRTSPDDRRRFGLVIDGVRPQLIEALPDVLHRLQVGGLSLGVWGREPDQTAESLSRVFDRLVSGWHEITLGLDALPPDPIFATRRRDELLPMLADRSETSDLDPWLVPLIDQFGQSVSRWRVGPISDPSAFFEPDLLGLARRASDRLAALVPGPELVLPWRPEFDTAGVIETPGVGSLSVLIPGGTGADAIQLFGQEWVGQDVEGFGADPLELSYVVEPAEPRYFGYRLGAAELIRRAVTFWSVHAPAEGDSGGCPSEFFSLADGWTWSEGRRPAPMPVPELASLRTAIDHLSERRVVGELRVAQGVKCYVLAPAEHAPPGRGGALVAWTEQNAGGQIRQFLGDGEITVVDIFGNASEPVPTSPWGTGSEESAGVEIHRISLGPEPVFVEGIDVDLARFIASFKLTPGFLESGYAQHEAAITFSNPWEGSITGSASVISPGGGVGNERDRTWTFTPRVSRFAAEAKSDSEIPVGVEFSPVEEAGIRDLVLDIDLIAPGLQRRLRVVTGFEIGLTNIELDVKYYSIAGSGDAVLEAILTNTGDEPRSLQLIATVPGYPRLRAAIDDLEPGVSASRRFTLERADQRLRGNQAFIGAVDRERNARLNKVVDTR